jgi:hypothetical protein
VKHVGKDMDALREDGSGAGAGASSIVTGYDPTDTGHTVLALADPTGDTGSVPDIGVVQVQGGAATIFNGGGRPWPRPDDGIEIELRPGFELLQGDAIVTGDDGASELVFLDNTVIRLGPETKLVLTEYGWDAATGQGVLKFFAEYGNFWLRTGLVADASTDGVVIMTPYGVIRAWDATLIGQVNPQDVATSLSLLENQDGSLGLAELSNDLGSSLLSDGGHSVSTGADAQPGDPTTLSQDQIAALVGGVFGGTGLEAFLQPAAGGQQPLSQGSRLFQASLTSSGAGVDASTGGGPPKPAIRSFFVKTEISTFLAAATLSRDVGIDFEIPEARATPPTLSTGPVTGNEDTAIPLTINAALSSAAGPQELLSVRISGIPAGAVLSDAGGELFRVPSNTLSGSITFTALDVGQNITFNGLTITPPPDADFDFNLFVTATSRNVESGRTASTSASIAVTVNAVADQPTDASEVIVANEDNAAETPPGSGTFTDNQPIFGLDFDGAVADQDGSESLTEIELTLNGAPAGTVLVDAAGAALVVGATVNLTVTTFGAGAGVATGTVTAVVGNTYTIALAAADRVQTIDSVGEVQVQVPQHQDGDFTIDVVVTSTETDPTSVDPSVAIATQTQTTTIDVTINAVADEPNVIANDIAPNEDNAIEGPPGTFTQGLPVFPLNLAATLVDIDDGSETITAVVITLPTNPPGFALTQGTERPAEPGVFDVNLADLPNVALITPTHFNSAVSGVVPITISVTASETNANPISSAADFEATTTVPFTVTVNAVNDAPVLTAPAPPPGDEDTAIAISGISIADVDVAEGNGRVEATLSVGNGTLTLATAGLIFSAGGIGEASMTFQGALADVNAALATLSYQGNLNFNGAETLQIGVSDLGNTGAGGVLTDSESVDIAVSPVNDAPAITAPAGVGGDEDAAIAVNSISIADVDVAEGTGQVEATLSVGNGTLTLGTTTGIAFSIGGNGQASMTFQGALADVNSALATLSYQGDQNFNGPDTLQIDASDLGNTGAGGVLTDSEPVDIAVSPVTDTFDFNDVSEFGANIVGFDIRDPAAAGGDVIDIADVLVGFGGTSADDAVDDGFLAFADSGGGTNVNVDVNGGGDGFALLATLEGLAFGATTQDDLTDNNIVV